jgi:hypothetical protein
VSLSNNSQEHSWKGIILSSPSKNMIGVAGEYYVCAELCRQNILALITPKNNPLFDIVASDPDGKRIISIQVKTMALENKQGWRLNVSSTEKVGNPNLYVVLVKMRQDGSNDYYVYKHDELAERVARNYLQYIKTPKRDGSKRKDVDFRWFDFREFTEADKARRNKWEFLGFSKILVEAQG